SFLPVGDSSVVFGVFIAREGSSPTQMKEIQDKVDAILHADDNILMDFTMTGATGFIASNQGITFIFLKPREQRAPIAVAAGQLMGKLGSIPGVFAFLRPFPVLEINTGTVSQNQGQYAFSISGVNANEVYETSGKMMGKLMQYPGFATVSSDFFNNTPNVAIDIRRDQAKMYGV